MIKIAKVYEPPNSVTYQVNQVAKIYNENVVVTKIVWEGNAKIGYSLNVFAKKLDDTLIVISYEQQFVINTYRDVDVEYQFPIEIDETDESLE